MRLLNTTTLKLTEFTRDVPPYAILSHTWGDEEVTFQEIGLPERHKKKGFRKIRWCCQQAKRDTLEWAWVDTCCIDKTSSAELSEAINSMYNWYREAQVCYVYLEDVPDLDADLDPGLDSDADDESEAALRWDDRFRPARWFTRGWCLQELIAPGAVEFYSAGWREIGTKLSLCERISKITGIPSNVLLDPDSALEGCCLAQRMSWASARKTSRVEDEAYCLLGIFGVHMPLLYGEGERAFYRLQEEIIRQTEDYSFLLWSEVPPDDRWLAPGHYFVFAPRPAYFRPRFTPEQPPRSQALNYQTLKRQPAGSPLVIPSPASSPTTLSPANLPVAWDPPQMTNRGLRVSLPGMVVPDNARWGRWRDPTAQVEYLLFTGFSYNGLAVCVRLAHDKRAGPDCYTRFSNLVLLVPPDVLLEHFAPRPIYLSTARRPPSNDPSEINSNPSNTPTGAQLLVKTLAPKYTVIDVTWVSFPETPLPIALANPASHTGVAPGRAAGWAWAGNLHVNPNCPSHYALDMTIQRDVNLIEGSPPPQTVRVHMNLQGRQGRSTCALRVGEDQAAAVASDRVRSVLAAGWFATASIKSVIRSTWSVDITLTLEVQAAPSGQQGSSTRGRGQQSLRGRQLAT